MRKHDVHNLQEIFLVLKSKPFNYICLKLNNYQKLHNSERIVHKGLGDKTLELVFLSVIIIEFLAFRTTICPKLNKYEVSE